MDVVLRTIAIFLETALLLALLYQALNGARLAIVDLGVGAKYQRFIAMALTLLGFLLLLFFIVHLLTFYPEIEIG